MFYATALNEYHSSADGKQHVRETMSVYATEIIGTALLAYIVGVSPTAGEYAALAIGAQVVALVYTGAATSGSHFNPAVTLGIYLRGLRERKPLLTFIQVVGSPRFNSRCLCLTHAHTPSCLRFACVYDIAGGGILCCPTHRSVCWRWTRIDHHAR